MKKNTLIVLTLCFVVACQAPPSQTSAEAPVPPNMVLIIADDMGWNDSGAYGHAGIQTPNLDRLAREGIRFTQAFLTTSSCSPSRSSIITGRYPHSTDAEQLHMPLPAEQITFVEELRKAGYWTGAAGKWHLGPAIRDRFDLILDNDLQAPIPQAMAEAGISPESAVKSGCSAWISLLSQRPADQPFFLWLAAVDPHRAYEDSIIPLPHSPEQVVVPPYLPDDPATRKDFVQYYDEVTRLDYYVGMVLDSLEAQGLAEQTVILFISDNGRPFPRAKTTLYDSGIQTPFIVRWPDRVSAGSTQQHLVSSVDIAPTFLELAGLQPGEHYQGKSFYSLLSARDPAPIREYIYAEHNWHDFDDHGRAVRSQRYKYIRNYYTDIPGTPPADAVRGSTYQLMVSMHRKGTLNSDQQQCFTVPRPREELYDLLEDPYELTNLAGSQAHEVTLQTLRAALDTWIAATGDKVPKIRTADEFDRWTGASLPNHQMPRLSKKERLEQGLLEY